MPLGFESECKTGIEARTRQPNSLINFIKPLETKDKAIAQDILERVAAIVYPVMRDNYLAVMALEEFPPNKEFWGRNFNFGEIVQLVLKSPTTGEWLPIHMVEQVMLHELAHVKEMNHSRDFHKLRLTFVDQLSKLKARGYTGEGFWAPGRIIHPSASLTADRILPKNEIPEDLCGGTFKRQRKRRRRGDKLSSAKPQLSAAERKERWLKKKFGSIEGTAIGGDEESRKELEGGKKVKGKPRVASSVRGRELRAEAALKRFAVQPKKEELEDEKGFKDEEDNDDTTSDEEDEKGAMVKVEDKDDDADALNAEFSALACGSVPLSVKKESSPLPQIIPVITNFGEASSRNRQAKKSQATSSQKSKPPSSVPAPKQPSTLFYDSDETTDEELSSNPKFVNKNQSDKSQSATPFSLSLPTNEALPISSINTSATADINVDRTPTDPILTSLIPPPSTTSPDFSPSTSTSICPICSTQNFSTSTICLICANVLRSELPSWSCTSSICKEGDGKYRNSLDCRICGVCGERRCD